MLPTAALICNNITSVALLTGEFSLSSFSSCEKRSKQSLSETSPLDPRLGIGSDRSQKTSKVLE